MRAGYEFQERVSDMIGSAMLRKSQIGNGRSTPTVLIATTFESRSTRCDATLSPTCIIHHVSQPDHLESSLGILCPDILLLDIAFVGRPQSIVLIRRLSHSNKIIVLTPHPNKTEALSVLKAGAQGYCHADIQQDVLTMAVESVEKGEVWIGRKLIPYVLAELVAARRAAHVPKLHSVH